MADEEGLAGAPEVRPGRPPHPPTRPPPRAPLPRRPAPPSRPGVASPRPLPRFPPALPPGRGTRHVRGGWLHGGNEICRAAGGQGGGGRSGRTGEGVARGEGVSGADARGTRQGEGVAAAPEGGEAGGGGEGTEPAAEVTDKGGEAGGAPVDARVVFVLGGPGSGKGTQCERLIAKYGVKHLSAGDLLRAEVASGSEVGQQCQEIMKEGKLVPTEVTLGLIKKAMAQSEQKTFIIDGFPRAVDQGEAFEAAIKPCEFVLFLDCPKETMQERLLKRGETSGRADDNLETIAKRFDTFMEVSMPVMDHFAEKVHKVSSVPAPDEVFVEVCKVFESRGIQPVAEEAGEEAGEETAEEEGTPAAAGDAAPAEDGEDGGEGQADEEEAETVEEAPEPKIEPKTEPEPEPELEPEEEPEPFRTIYTRDDVLKYLLQKGLQSTFNEMVAFLATIKPENPLPFLHEHFDNVSERLAPKGGNLFAELVKSAEVAGHIVNQHTIAPGAQQHLDVHLVKEFFEDFVQELIKQDLPAEPMVLLQQRLAEAAQRVAKV